MPTSNDSIYDSTYSYGENIKNTGYSYRGNIMQKSVSKYLYKNSNVAGFLDYLDSIFYEYIEAVKKIRVYYNFTVDKNYKKLQ